MGARLALGNCASVDIAQAQEFVDASLAGSAIGDADTGRIVGVCLCWWNAEECQCYGCCRRHTQYCPLHSSSFFPDPVVAVLLSPLQIECRTIVMRSEGPCFLGVSGGQRAAFRVYPQGWEIKNEYGINWRQMAKSIVHQRNARLLAGPSWHERSQVPSASSKLSTLRSAASGIVPERR